MNEELSRRLADSGAKAEAASEYAAFKQELEQRAMTLVGLLGNLEKRLAPVMQPPTEINGTDTEAPKMTAPVLNDLLSVTRKVNDAINIAQEITKRLVI